MFELIKKSVAILSVSTLVICAGYAKSAYSQEVDAIFVVDTSGSMADEVNVFVQNFNTAFAPYTGPNFHIILISSATLCIPQPIGSGLCPGDENLPGFRHVISDIGSNNALEQIISTYDQWETSLRPGAKKFIMVLTDDNSSMPYNNFNDGLLAIAPSLQDYEFYGMIDASCPVIGEEYIQLASLTNGKIYDLCQAGGFIAPYLQDFATIIAANITEPPTESTCEESSSANIDQASAYLKHARYLKRKCKSEGIECELALQTAESLFSDLINSHNLTMASCP